MLSCAHKMCACKNAQIVAVMSVLYTVNRPFLCRAAAGSLKQSCTFSSSLDHECVVKYPQKKCSVMWQIHCYNVMQSLAHNMLQLATSM